MSEADDSRFMEGSAEKVPSGPCAACEPRLWPCASVTRKDQQTVK